MKTLLIVVAFLFTGYAAKAQVKTGANKAADLSRFKSNPKSTKTVSVPNNKKQRITASAEEKPIVKGEEAPNSFSRKMPADFPKFNDTGNPRTDAADYQKRKRQWIENNPEKYKKLKGKSTSTTSVIAPDTKLIPSKGTK
jgi:hypothetical protein